MTQAIDQVSRFAKCTASFDSHEVRQIELLAEASKDCLQSATAKLVDRADHGTILQMTGVDCTPIQVSSHCTVSLPSGKAVRRSGKTSHEFLVGAQFTMCTKPTGLTDTRLCFRDPLPLTHGKTVDRIFEGMRGQTKTLREYGHRGGCVQGYCFDRCGLHALARRILQIHRLMSPSFLTDTTTADLLWLLELVVIVACSLHDLHNAFKWSLPDDYANTDLLRAAYIGVESIRNSFDDILSHLGEWIALC
jgi:hypothetical protein